MLALLSTALALSAPAGSELEPRGLGKWDDCPKKCIRGKKDWSIKCSYKKEGGCGAPGMCVDYCREFYLPPGAPPPPPEHFVVWCDAAQQEIQSVCAWFIEAWTASDGMPDMCSMECLKLLRKFSDCAHEKHYNNYTTMVTQCDALNQPYSPPPMKLPAKPPSPPSLPYPPQTPCVLPWNLREKLEPPEGTGWRGSTLGVDKLQLGGTFSDMQDPEEYE